MPLTQGCHINPIELCCRRGDCAKTGTHDSYQLVLLGILSFQLCFRSGRRVECTRITRVKSLDKRVQKLQNQVDALVERNLFSALKSREETSREEAPDWSSEPQPPVSESSYSGSPEITSGRVANNRRPLTRLQASGSRDAVER
jgi:hypothetical protein